MTKITFADYSESEGRTLAREMELVRIRRLLVAFAAKADKWEANHTHVGSDSTQVSHRLGDFRAARNAIGRIDRILEGSVERPFAHCCAEAGGRVSGCDCVHKNHGTAWFSLSAARSFDTKGAE